MDFGIKDTSLELVLMHGHNTHTHTLYTYISFYLISNKLFIVSCKRLLNLNYFRLDNKYHPPICGWSQILIFQENMFDINQNAVVLNIFKNKSITYPSFKSDPIFL